ncbi:MAG TPA: leucyl/phenylalanyl-tRNA--protein transferase [Rhodanobacteraceae bacterium]|nr:leucyl/phenylalanyl-tRNA--protein transferase [Rhodanobacteraceae bacterium]
MRIPILRAGTLEAFPPVESALAEPDGLLAAGGDLSPERLLAAYRRGIFPWYSRGQPILWWSPDPRTVFETDRMHVPRRLARALRTCEWTIRADSAFDVVVRACAAPRAHQRGTWIDAAMRKAYQRLHELGHAHSIEAWDDDTLVGGIYGVAIGRMFFGESMFSAVENGSKVALLALASTLRRWDFPLLDAQVASPHLFTLGATEIERASFCASVAELCRREGIAGSWRDIFPALRPRDFAAGATERRSGPAEPVGDEPPTTDEP